MSEINPYEPPGAPFEIHSGSGIDAPRVASGQKLVIYACILYIGAGILQSTIGLVAGVFVLAALVMALIGVAQVMSGLAWSLLAKIVTFTLMFVPVINLIMLLVVNSKATEALRNAGYRVGIFGASK